MNARTVKLLRSYARSSGITLTAAKREWNTTPRDKRGDIRAEMERNLWRKQLLEFKAKHDYVGKQAAGVLNVPHDTWRSWESMRATPPKFVQILLSTVMRNHVKAIAGGAAALTAWLGSGCEPVNQETAQKRTDICLKCPMNIHGPIFIESIAKAIKSQVEVRNALGLRTNGIRSLLTCEACSCYLPLKIFVPLNRILPTDEEKRKLHPDCWLLHEKA